MTAGRPMIAGASSLCSKRGAGQQAARTGRGLRETLGETMTDATGADVNGSYYNLSYNNLR